MLFSSLEFLFLFLPIMVMGYYLLSPFKHGKLSLLFLFIGSMFFYAYWNLQNTWVLVVSILGNYFLGMWIHISKKFRKFIFIFAILCNVFALMYFKYTNFLIDILNVATSAHIHTLNIILPLGISFFVFQKIAYLADIYTYKHDPSNNGLLNFGLFASFFPQLIAGPIVHHKELMPQIASKNNLLVNWKNIYSGFILLSLGLAKKIILADNLAQIVRYSFDSVGTLTFAEAILASIAYSLQLYFDFSGYSDMAIGCALFFNIVLPQNFSSPYKALSIQDFWRKWHITLSRWLRDYLYIPLGGNRCGTIRTLGNLFITFLIGGIWHGAAWTYILWGALHGIALILQRMWSRLCSKSMPAVLGWGITFLFVNFAWVVFRVQNLSRLGKFCDSFLGYNGFMYSVSFKEGLLKIMYFSNFTQINIFVFTCLTVAVLGKNSFEILAFKDNLVVNIAAPFLFAASIIQIVIGSTVPEFIYFQF